MYTRFGFTLTKSLTSPMLPTMYLSTDLFELHTKKPRGLARWLLIGWAVMLALVLLAPNTMDKLLWNPGEWFSVTGLFLLPFVWGNSVHIQTLGALLAGITMWFFGSDLEFRLGRRRFLAYLSVASMAGFAGSWGWARLFQGQVPSLAPYMALSVAYGACRLHRKKVLVWRQYGLGKVSVLFLLLLGGVALNLLLTAFSAEPLDQAIGSLCTLLTASFFLEPRWPKGLRAWWILRKNRFGKHKGRWGYN